MPHSRYHTKIQHIVTTGYDRSPDNLTICFRRFVQRRFFCIITIILIVLADSPAGRTLMQHLTTW